jgi:hypothetical protein
MLRAPDICQFAEELLVATERRAVFGWRCTLSDYSCEALPVKIRQPIVRTATFFHDGAA